MDIETSVVSLISYFLIVGGIALRTIAWLKERKLLNLNRILDWYYFLNGMGFFIGVLGLILAFRLLFSQILF
jgi:hypothetical protein